MQRVTLLLSLCGLITAGTGCSSSCALLFDEGRGVKCETDDACPGDLVCGSSGTCEDPGKDKDKDAGATADSGVADSGDSPDTTMADVQGIDGGSDAQGFDAAAFDTSTVEDSGTGDGALPDGLVVVDALLADQFVVASDAAEPDTGVPDAYTPDTAPLVFSVGGTVSNLLGSGLILQNNGGSDLAISALSTSFVFPQEYLDGAGFNVTIMQQPTAPIQDCQVTTGTGTGSISGADVESVAIVCTTRQFTVSGTVSGLVGSGLVLQNRSGDDLPISADGGFTFPAPVDDHSSYSVTVLTQPVSPEQTCSITNAQGQVLSSNVSNVIVSCQSGVFLIGGDVYGLDGQGLVIANGGDSMTIFANGPFSFATPVADATGYDVVITQQPNELSQTCTVASGSGTVSGAQVEDIVITCVTNQFTIGGSVTGLEGTGLKLLYNGEEISVPSTATGFEFATPYDDGTGYTVVVSSQPTQPSQDCELTNPTGVLAGADVESIAVVCTTNAFTIGGTISGLVGSTLRLELVGYEVISLDSPATSFTFNPHLVDQTSFSVIINNQPRGPSQTCSISGGDGTLDGEDVTTIAVNCVTNTYEIGGTISGLTGDGLILQNNSGDDLPVSAGSSDFTFGTPLEDESPYSVTVLANPANQECTVDNASGNLNGDAVDNVEITCLSYYDLRISVQGLNGELTVVNDAEPLTITSDGDHPFATQLLDGTGYDISISVQPECQSCSINSSSGTINGQAATVHVSCMDNEYSLMVDVVGLDASDSVEVIDVMTSETEEISQDGTVVFPNIRGNGAPYRVEVSRQPNNRKCYVINGVGVVQCADVTDVTVVCAVEYLVESSEDMQDKIIGDGECLSDNGNCTLRAAIQESNNDGVPNIITLSAQRFYLTGNQVADMDDLAAEGDLDILDDLGGAAYDILLKGQGTTSTFIDGNNTTRLFDIMAGARVMMQGVSLVKGQNGGYTGYAANIRVDGLLKLEDCYAADHSGSGNGTVFHNDGSLSIFRSLIEYNTSGNGVVANTDSGTLLLVESTISSNGAGNMGGGFWSYGEATVVNSTISGNESCGTSCVTGQGGAIAITGGTLRMVNTTVAHNRLQGDGSTGGVYVNPGATASIVNTALCYNENAGSEPSDCAGTPASEGYNVVAANTCNMTVQTNDNFGTAAQPVDCQLEQLMPVGGPTPVHMPSEQSPLVDNGNNLECPEFDQRGVVRPYPENGTCDIGAVEYNQ